MAFVFNENADKSTTILKKRAEGLGCVELYTEFHLGGVYGEAGTSPWPSVQMNVEQGRLRASCVN